MYIATHLLTPFVPPRVRLPGEELQSWSEAHLFNHSSHLLRLLRMDSSRSMKCRHTLCPLPSLNRLVWQLTTYPKEAVFGETAIVLAEAHSVFNPRDSGFVGEPPRLHDMHSIMKVIVG